MCFTKLFKGSKGRAIANFKGEISFHTEGAAKMKHQQPTMVKTASSDSKRFCSKWRIWAGV